jgi:preprotein translocase subunit SecG
MQSVLIVIHLMVVVVLVVTVLLQRSEGGALGMGGASGFMTGRGQASALTRATAILAALFFATSMGLTILARFNQAPEITFQSITPIEPPSEGAAKKEGKESLLDQLRQMEEQAAKPPALPPGLALPGQPLPATPAAPESLNLPPINQPATPLVPPATVQTGPTAPPAPPASITVKPAPSQAAPVPFKPQLPASTPPWSK